MKKNIIWLMILLVVYSFSGCGNSGGTNAEGTNIEQDNTENFQSTDINSAGNTKVTEELVRAHKPAPASDFEYEDIGDGIKILKYVGNDNIVVIPEIIEGKPVIELKAYLFANESSVEGVLIPDNILNLKNTFVNNDDIRVVICESVEGVLDYTFGNCSSLQLVSLSKNLKRLGEGAFCSCHSLKEIHITKNMEEIIESVPGTVFIDSPQLIIKGSTGSYIEAYAKEHNIKFVAE